MKPKPYRARTLSGAQRAVRSMDKLWAKTRDLLESRHRDCLTLAKLAADGLAFSNPAEFAEAMRVRDKYLRWMGMNPDGTRIGGKS